MSKYKKYNNYNNVWHKVFDPAMHKNDATDIQKYIDNVSENDLIEYIQTVVLDNRVKINRHDQHIFQPYTDDIFCIIAEFLYNRYHCCTIK